MFLRNVGCISTDYTASYPRRSYSSKLGMIKRYKPVIYDLGSSRIRATLRWMILALESHMIYGPSRIHTFALKELRNDVTVYIQRLTWQLWTTWMQQEPRMYIKFVSHYQYALFELYYM
jgi:hypothetical protein